MIRFTTLFAAFALATLSSAQQPSIPAPAEPSSQGQVLFHRNDQQAVPENDRPAGKVNRTPESVIASITDAERSALVVESRSLDLHLTPARSYIDARSLITVRNTSPAPVGRLVLQLSSTLQWDKITDHATLAPLTFTQHTIATDADHTGEATEAVITLPHPLAPNSALTLSALYSGTIPSSAARLTRIGAPPEQAIRADWDSISPGSIALRGFGDVLWYPVSSPPLFLGDGAKLFQAIGRSRRQQMFASFHLRLTIEYIGEPPVDGFFNGQRQTFAHTTEEPNVPVAESHGVAIAEFPRPLVGFRTPNLFVTWNAAHPSENQLLSVITAQPEAIAAYNTAANDVAPLLRDWLGASPLTPLTLIDHPDQPFEDDALLALPLNSTDSHQIAASLVHSLAHAWFHSSLPWLNEGVPQFMAILQSEAVDGRDSALAGLRGLLNPLAMIEPETLAAEVKPVRASTADVLPSAAQRSNIPFDPRNLPGPPESYSSSSSSSNSSVDAAVPTPAPPATLQPPPGQTGQSLIDAQGEIYYRAKAAAVLVMLRSVTGDAALKRALQAYRTVDRIPIGPSVPSTERTEDPRAFQHAIEDASHKDLSWLFDDWVYNDRGIADLSIVNVTPRSLPARNGKDVSWLVSVEIRNSSSVNVEVPVTVRSGTLTSTERVRIPPQSSVSTRIVFEGVPQEVQLNDGTVPETTAPMHVQRVQIPGTAEK